MCCKSLTSDSADHSSEENVELLLGEARPYIVHKGVYLAQAEHAQSLSKMKEQTTR